MSRPMRILWDFAYEEGETYLEEFLQELDIESKS